MINDIAYTEIAVKNEKNMYIGLTDAVMERYKEKIKRHFAIAGKGDKIVRM